MNEIFQNDMYCLRFREAASRRTGSTAFWTLLIVALFLTNSVIAQREEEEIRIPTELAAFEVTVTDERGNPVRNLSERDFRIYEEGMQRQIDFFQPIRKSNSGRPLSVVFALDVSGSMTPTELDRLQTAMQNFVGRLADYNSYFAVMSFAMDVRTLQSFTNRPDRVTNSFQKLSREQNGLSTHAYDAVDEAVRMLARKSPKTLRNQLPRKVVILITDGFPVGDTVGPATVIERANAAETTVYSVILPSFSRLQRTKDPLPTPLEASGLVERTGGKTFYASATNFEPLFASLAEEVTATYAIAFYPDENRTQGDQIRHVRIESRPGLTVRQNRTSYTLK
ncbi:MAG: VWA domain-containing protein [Acidobacteria bacterium]|nr:VWA domain-containing protein [Acidobacteriota bacterium]MCA1608591.1 VWA domain-containing protein [Acidobacteriota bacterium]